MTCMKLSRMNSSVRVWPSTLELDIVAEHAKSGLTGTLLSLPTDAPSKEGTAAPLLATVLCPSVLVWHLKPDSRALSALGWLEQHARPHGVLNICSAAAAQVDVRPSKAASIFCPYVDNFVWTTWADRLHSAKEVKCAGESSKITYSAWLLSRSQARISAPRDWPESSGVVRITECSGRPASRRATVSHARFVSEVRQEEETTMLASVLETSWIKFWRQARSIGNKLLSDGCNRVASSAW